MAIRHYFWLTKQTHRFWHGFLSQAITWFATDRNVQRRKSGMLTKRVNWFKKVYTPVVKKVYTQASNLVKKVYTPVAVQ